VITALPNNSDPICVHLRSLIKGIYQFGLFVVEQKCNILANSAICTSCVQSVEIKLQRAVQNGEYLQNLRFTSYFFFRTFITSWCSLRYSVFVHKNRLLQYCMPLSLLGKCYCLIIFFCAFVTNSLKNVSINFTMSNLIIVQQDETVFSLLYSCRQLYMFRVLTPIIRSWHSCNYSFWHWSTGSATINVNGHDTNILLIFSQALYKAPWWWILCDPKYVGALLNIL